MPADRDGSPPPRAGAKNYQLELASPTKLNLSHFHGAFAFPANSTFTGPTQLAVPSYTDACAATGTCIVQPSPGEKLDALGDRLMYRLAYRNFGDHEALMLNHSIKPSGTDARPSAVPRFQIRTPHPSQVDYQKD